MVSKRAQHLRSPLPVQPHRIHSLHDRRKPSLPLLPHPLQHTQHRLVHIIIEDIAELLQRHPGNPRKCLCVAEHHLYHLPERSRRHLSSLAILVESGSKAEDLVDAYVCIRGNTGHSLREVHHIPLVSRRCHAQLIDSRTHLQHRLLHTVHVLQTEYVRHLPDSCDRSLRITAEILRQGHIDLVCRPDETQKIVTPLDTQLTSSSGQCQKVVLRSPRVDTCKCLAQLRYLLLRQVRRLHRIRQGLIILCECTCSLRYC